MFVRMKVRIKKVHDAWNMLYPGEFTVGDILELDKGIITSKNGRRFDACELAKCFSISKGYDNIFEKV